MPAASSSSNHPVAESPTSVAPAAPPGVSPSPGDTPPGYAPGFSPEIARQRAERNKAAVMGAAVGCIGACLLMFAVWLSSSPGGDVVESEAALGAEPMVLSFDEVEDDRPTIAFFGDSILGEVASGFGAATSADIRTIDATLRFCGLVQAEATRTRPEEVFVPTDECTRLPQQWSGVLLQEPQAVIVSAARWDATWKDLGGSDFVTPCSDQAQLAHRAALESLVGVAQSWGAQVGLVTMPDPRGAENGSFTDCMNNIYRRVAEATGAELLDLDVTMSIDADPSGLLDGLHFTDAGRTAVAAEILERFPVLSEDWTP